MDADGLTGAAVATAPAGDPLSGWPAGPAAAPKGGAQRIPRPRHVRPGGGASWPAATGTGGIGIDQVRAAMGRRGPSVPVPGVSPHVELPGLDRPGSRPAAVLVPIFEEGGESRVILTRRSSSLRSHTGEVSFPGGRLDHDELPVAAALREASEEVGLEPVAVEIVGQLSPLSTFSSRSVITPFVGIMATRPSLRPNPAEVARVFDVSLAELASEDVYHRELWHLPDTGWREMNFFELPGDTVWGATARMLKELLEVVLAG